MHRGKRQLNIFALVLTSHCHQVDGGTAELTLTATVSLASPEQRAAENRDVAGGVPGE